MSARISLETGHIDVLTNTELGSIPNEVSDNMAPRVLSWLTTVLFSIPVSSVPVSTGHGLLNILDQAISLAIGPGYWSQNEKVVYCIFT
jgi:hypothetical protein